MNHMSLIRQNKKNENNKRINLVKPADLAK